MSFSSGVNVPAVLAARRHDASARVPFCIGAVAVGSVARAHLHALHEAPSGLAVLADRVTLTAPAAERDSTLAAINAHLRAAGLLRGWRNEIFTIVDPAGKATGSATANAVLARTERAAARFWGTLTQGAHANGWVAGADGRPAHLWIARRALNKSTDPGLLDNLVGGGVPDGQTPWQALMRESWEEAGLAAEQAAKAQPAGLLRVHREVAHGLQFEDLHAYDLALPEGFEPRNQDGEVQGFACLPVGQALALAMGHEMTVDSALVTLDFGLRHGLQPAGLAWDPKALAAALAALRPPA
jgi:8-oxo-dGTP pyrophosphatase MutT (NUDIX family)